MGVMPDPDPYVEESDALTEFNRTWNIKLASMREKEAEMESQVRAKAAEDLANWNKQREVRLNAKKESNRTEEQVLIESLESESDPACNTWERVLKLVDATAESSDSKKADMSRMRKLLFQLKNDPSLPSK